MLTLLLLLRGVVTVVAVASRLVAVATATTTTGLLAAAAQGEGGGVGRENMSRLELVPGLLLLLIVPPPVLVVVVGCCRPYCLLLLLLPLFGVAGVPLVFLAAAEPIRVVDAVVEASVGGRGKCKRLTRLVGIMVQLVPPVLVILVLLLRG